MCISANKRMNVDKPVMASDIPANAVKSVYPEPFATLMQGRDKKKLGDFFGLENFGINLTELAPGAISALKHTHSKQDEFIYILSGSVILVYGDHEYTMYPGECFGFRAGNEIAHQLVNRSDDVMTYLEVGDRSLGDTVDYPDDDLCAYFKQDGTWGFTHKDGSDYVDSCD